MILVFECATCLLRIALLRIILRGVIINEAKKKNHFNSGDDHINCLQRDLYPLDKLAGDVHASAGYGSRTS